MKQITLVVPLLVALLGVATEAQAQQGQQGQMMGHGSMMTGMVPCGPGMMMHDGSGTMMQMPMMHGMGPMMGAGTMMAMGPMMGGPGQHIEGRLAFLKTELAITPAQEQVWNAYAEALRASASSMQGMHDQMMSGAMPATVPERMQWHSQMMSSRLGALNTLRAAAVPLYNALSPEQKQRANELMGSM
jgi:hypothetical protein